MPRKNRVVSRSHGTSKDRVREGLGRLTPQEVEFIRMRFGSGGRKAHTLKEVGQKFSVTEEQIQQADAMSKEMFIQAHYELMEEYLIAFPNTSFEEAFRDTSPLVYNRYYQNWLKELQSEGNNIIQQIEKEMKENE